MHAQCSAYSFISKLRKGEPRKNVNFYGFVHFLTMLQLFFPITDWRLFSISYIFYISKVLTKVCLRHKLNRTKQQKYLITENMFLGLSREFWSNSTPFPFWSQIHSHWLGHKVGPARQATYAGGPVRQQYAGVNYIPQSRTMSLAAGLIGDV